MDARRRCKITGESERDFNGKSGVFDSSMSSARNIDRWHVLLHRCIKACGSMILTRGLLAHAKAGTGAQQQTPEKRRKMQVFFERRGLWSSARAPCGQHHHGLGTLERVY